MRAEDEPGSRRDRRLLVAVVAGIAVVLGGLYLAGYAFASDRLPRDTTVAGVDVGGLRPQAAERRLQQRLGPRLDDPLEVIVADRRWSLPAEELGLDVDVPASVDQVPVGSTWNVADMWEVFVGGEDYDAVVVHVDDMLTTRLERLAARVSEPPVEGAVSFTASGPRATYPRSGTALDVDAAAAALTAAYPSDGEPVELTLETAEPEITETEVSRAMEEFANPAMSAPVTYRVGDAEVVLQPGDYAPALSMDAVDGRLEPRVDERRFVRVLERGLQAAGRTLGEEPRDAGFRIVDGRPVVVPARQGVALDTDRLVESFVELVADEGDRTMRVPTQVAEPELTTAEAKSLGITEQVSEFTTYYPHADYRNVNIGRAAELIDGTILEPGETFSLNETVGERTRENGFTEGFIISDGVFKEDLGGGVSQVATTTFNAMFYAGLEDVEHKPHSFYIDRYPVGREATVAWPTVDLRFRNDTDYGVLITTELVPSTFSSQGAITVRMWSTKVWDISARTGERYAYTAPDTRYLSGPDCVPNTGYSGFQIVVTRVFREAGESRVHHTERFHTTYTPSDTVICR